LDNQRKRQQKLHENTKQIQEKNQKQSNKQHKLYQAAIKKCDSKEKLTVKDYLALVKHCTIAGYSPLGKNSTELVEQLRNRINRLKPYLPIVVFKDIKKHALSSLINDIDDDALRGEEWHIFNNIKYTPKLQKLSKENVYNVPPIQICTGVSIKNNFLLEKDIVGEGLLSFAMI
jgi:hypothetical protein